MTEIERLRKLREQVKSALSNPVRFTERAVNAQLRKEGVDAVLFRTRGDKE